MSAWYLLEDCKKKAAAILGSDKDIPNEKADLGKLAQAVGDAYSDISAAAQELAEKLDVLVDTVGSVRSCADCKVRSSHCATHDEAITRRAMRLA